MYRLILQLFKRKLLHRINTSYYLKLLLFKKIYYLFFLISVTREKMSPRFLIVIVFLFSLCSAHGQYTKYYYPNGIVSSEGTLQEGKPNDYWITYYDDGGLKSEGNRVDFLLDSTWKFYRTDTTLERIITYKLNLKNGPEQYFDKSGVMLEETMFKNNIKDGKTKQYFESGELKKEIPFINNKEEGRGFEYAKDGRIITISTYRNGFIYAEEIINRYNSEGKRTGTWKDLYPLGNVKEEGNWTNGLRNGIFKFYTKRGDLDRIEKYENGILITDQNNEAAIIDIRQEFYENGNLRMEGSYVNNKKNGTFREYNQEGKQINAYIFENEIRTGEGMIDSIGRRQGPWKLYYTNGALRAEGAYKDGKRDGPWAFYFQNGKLEQKGTYKEDLPSGAWKWFYISGATHREENYRKGKEDGHSVEYDSIGNPINEGDYVDGLKTGKWRLSVNDHTEEGEYLDGELNGEWIWKYDNGQKAFEGEFQSGIPVGKHKYWYRNGIFKMRGGFEGGELSGRWEYYRENGTLDLEIEYEAGEAVKINGQKIKLPKNKEED